MAWGLDAVTAALELRNGRGERLAAVLHGVPGRSAVVICHGMLSTKESPKHRALAEALAHRGLACLRFDFAGRGSSEGRLFDLCYSHQLDDLSAAVAALVARGVERIGLFGSSMGGAVALLAAATESRVVAVATMAAVGRLDAIAARRPEAVRAWERDGQVESEEGPIGRGYLDDLPRHDVLAATATLRAPLLVIHGDADEVVPWSDAEAIVGVAAEAQLDIVPGADHSFSDPTQRAAALDMVADFLHAALAERALLPG